MSFVSLNNATLVDFSSNSKLQIKQGDNSPIAIKLNRKLSKSGEATVYLSDTKRAVIYKDSYTIKNGVLYFIINNILPVGIYYLEIYFEGQKYPSDDKFIIKINESAEIAQEDIVNLDTIQSIENNILTKLNNKIESNILEYIDKNKELFEGVKGDKGESFKYEDFTEQQLELLKGKDGQNGTNGKDGKSITVVSNTVDSEQNIIVTFSDNTVIKIPKGIKGSDGINGSDGSDGSDGKSLTFDELTEEQKTDLKGEQGKSITILDSSIDELGNTVIKFSDNSTVTINKGNTGATGKDVSIAISKEEPLESNIWFEVIE